MVPLKYSKLSKFIQSRFVMKWDISALMGRVQRVCIIQAVLNLIYLIYYISTEPFIHKSTILLIISVSFSVCLGTWGWFAARNKSRARLIIYLLLTVVAQSILVSSNITVQYSLNDNCDLTQAYFRGCENMPCAQNNTCSKADIDGTDCLAPPSEICSTANSNKYIAAVVIQSFAACLPSCFSFVAIVRISKFEEDEEATYGKTSSVRYDISGDDNPLLKQNMALTNPVGSTSTTSLLHNDSINSPRGY